MSGQHPRLHACAHTLRARQHRALPCIYPDNHAMPRHTTFMQHPPAAGTRQGITACQLDVKLAGGVPLEILERAFEAAARGRAKVLTAMEAALPKVCVCMCGRVCIVFFI